MKIKNRIFIAVLSLFVGVQIYGAQMNPEDNQNIALYYAVRSGDQQRAQAALDAGADANWQVTQDAVNQSGGILTEQDVGNCLLYLPVQNNNLEMVRFLLDRGATANAATRHDKTSLYYAINKNNLRMVQLLLDHVVDQDIIDQEVERLDARVNRTAIQNEILDLLYTYQFDTTLK